MVWNEIILGFEQEQLRYTAGCLFVLVVRASRFERERRERRGLGKDWVVLERVRVVGLICRGEGGGGGGGSRVLRCGASAPPPPPEPRPNLLKERGQQ